MDSIVRQDWILRIVLAITTATLACVLMLEAILTLAIRIKAGGWWKNSLLYIILHRVWRGVYCMGERYSLYMAAYFTGMAITVIFSSMVYRGN